MNNMMLFYDDDNEAVECTEFSEGPSSPPSESPSSSASGVDHPPCKREDGIGSGCDGGL
jgi:hypothetical protein